MGTITTKQIKKLRALASWRFPDDELYHAWLEQQFNVESTKDLSVGQASRAIWLLLPDEQRGKKPGIYPQGSGRGDHLTPKQARKIGGLAADMGWDRASLVSFIRRQTGLNKSVEMLSVKEAVKVITGMERVFNYNQQSGQEK